MSGDSKEDNFNSNTIYDQNSQVRFPINKPCFKQFSDNMK